jgi:hypothetical protein
MEHGVLKKLLHVNVSLFIAKNPSKKATARLQVVSVLTRIFYLVR